MLELDRIVNACAATFAALLLVGAGVAHGQPAPQPPRRPRTDGARRRLGQLLQSYRCGPRRGGRVLPRRHRLRRAGRADDHGCQPAAQGHVRLAGRAPAPADRARAADSGRCRDRRNCRCRWSAARAGDARPRRRHADRRRARYRCDARATEAARRARRDDRRRSRSHQRRAAARVLVQDPAGHFVELLQAGVPPPVPTGGNANVASVRIRHTVENLERSLALYRDALGLQGGARVPRYDANPSVLALLGLPPERNTVSRH